MSKWNHPQGPTPPLDPVAHLLTRVAWLMDRSFRIPGTKIPIGLDALLGLVPVGGDFAAGLVQAGLVLIALGRYRVPPAVAARMMSNVLVDVAVGAIPLVGDVFDIAFKANTRNLRLLEPYLGATPRGKWLEPGPGGKMIEAAPPATPWGCLLGIAVALVGTLALVLIGFVVVIRWIVRG